MSSKVYKQHELTIDIGASSRTNIITNTTFFTMDIKTGQKVIKFTLEGERFDLTDATVMLGFEFVDKETTKIIDSKDGSIIIERPRRGECSVVLPNHLYQYSGQVLVHAYIMFDDGRSFDAGIIVTEFKESWLDSELEEMTDFYVKRFEDLAEEIKQRADRLEEMLNGVDKSIVSQDDFDAHVNATTNPHPAQTTITGNAGTATQLQTPRQINGTNFNGSTNITTNEWGASRGITIGDTTRSVNGACDVSWSIEEIGAAQALHTHSTLQVQEQNPNLNNYKDEGDYYFDQNIIGAIVNRPQNSVSGWLNVTKGLADRNGNVLISQKWHRGTNSPAVVAETWTRFYHQATDQWSQWVPIAMFPWALGAHIGVHQSGRTVHQFGTILLAGGANVIRSQTINFNTAAPFGTTPNIQVSFVSTNPQTTVVSLSHESATSFQINVVVTSTSSVSVRWLAAGATTPTMV